MPLLQSLCIYNFIRTLPEVNGSSFEFIYTCTKVFRGWVFKSRNNNNYCWMETAGQHGNIPWLPSALLMNLHVHFLIKTINSLLSLSLKVELPVARPTMNTSSKSSLVVKYMSATSQMSVFKKSFLQGISIIKKKQNKPFLEATKTCMRIPE